MLNDESQNVAGKSSTDQVESICALCGSMESQEVKHGVRYGPDLSVRCCRVCGLVFLWPCPQSDQLAAYYVSEFRAQYLGSIDPEKTYTKRMSEGHDRARRLLPYVHQNTSVLDVGASSGAFLDSISGFVGEAVGVELDEAHREWGCKVKGLTIVPSLAELGDKRFGLITLLHTLEHVESPIRFLRQLAEYLEIGGRLAIEVPNVTDALLTIYNIPTFSGFYYQRAHLYYFSADTLRRTIETAGGKGLIEGIQRYDLSNHIRWMLSGEPGGQGYYRDVLTGEANTAYAAALIKSGHADTLWAIATFG